MQKIKTGDHVMVIAGRSKNTQGVVKRVYFNDDGVLKRVLVEGANMISKHVKANPQQDIEGGIIKREAPMHISNVMILNTITQKPDRVGIKTIDGKKCRYFKSNGEVIDI
jgi:large subunit ribosomal protein L24